MSLWFQQGLLDSLQVPSPSTLFLNVFEWLVQLVLFLRCDFHVGGVSSLNRSLLTPQAVFKSSSQVIEFSLADQRRGQGPAEIALDCKCEAQVWLDLHLYTAGVLQVFDGFRSYLCNGK